MYVCMYECLNVAECVGGSARNSGERHSGRLGTHALEVLHTQRRQGNLDVSMEHI
jgi:hypothetical protein